MARATQIHAFIETGRPASSTGPRRAANPGRRTLLGFFSAFMLAGAVIFVHGFAKPQALPRPGPRRYPADYQILCVVPR